MATRRLEVEFVGDTKNLERAFGRVGKNADQGRSKFAAFGKAVKVGVLAVGGAAAAAGPKLVSLASDAEETASKFQVVFGKETPRAIKQLDAFSKATGTSKFALREQASDLQALVRPMGLTTRNAADMSVGMTKLATDLASFNNTSVEDAILALKSGLVGESEPLRKYGVQLSAARVQAFAYANGIAKAGTELTSAQKAQATYALILKDTKLAQGDAIRTSGSFANQFKRLKAQVTDTATELGVKLLPVATKVVSAITGFIAGMKDGTGVGGAFVNVVNRIAGAVKATVGGVASLVGWFKQHETVAMALGAALGVVLTAFAGFKILAAVQAAIVAVRAAMVGLNVAMLANPVGLVVAGLAALAAGLVVAYKESETFRKIVDGAWKTVKAVASWLVTAGVAAFNALKNTVVAAWNAIKTSTQTVWKAVKAVLTTMWTGIRTVATTYFNAYRRIVTTAWQAVSTVTSTVWNGIKTTLGTVWGAIKTAATTAWQAVRTAVVNPVRTAVEAVKGALGSEGLLGWLRDRFDTFKDVAEKLAKPFVAAFDKIAAAVKKVLDFLGKVTGAVKDVINFIGKIKIPKISLPSLPFGGKGNGTTVGPGNPGLLNSVQSIADYSLKWGLSGGRGPGQAYRPGDDGWHGQNRARDLSGPPATMLAFAKMLFRTMGPRLLELIYTPMGIGIKNGRPVDIMSFYGRDVAADHYDHVHVAMKDGGFVKRGGWALVGEEGPELAKLPTGTTVFPHGAGPASGSMVNIEHLEVHDRFDEQRLAVDLAWRLQVA